MLKTYAEAAPKEQCGNSCRAASLALFGRSEFGKKFVYVAQHATVAL
jgi:hypothetical protein